MKSFSRYRGETLTLAATASIGAAQVRVIPKWANFLLLHAPSATLENILINLGPRIEKVYFFDASAANAEWGDITDKLQDRNTAITTEATLNSMTTSDFIYVACKSRYRGVMTDIVNANSNAATLTVAYPSSGAAGGLYLPNNLTWTSLSATDNTASGGATLAVDGLITWTVPPAWQPVRLDLGPGGRQGDTESLWWVRMSVSAALDATVSLDQMAALANTALNVADGTSDDLQAILMRSNNDTQHPFEIWFDSEVFGSLEVTSTSITSAINLNWLHLLK